MYLSKERKNMLGESKKKKFVTVEIKTIPLITSFFNRSLEQVQLKLRSFAVVTFIVTIVTEVVELSSI